LAVAGVVVTLAASSCGGGGNPSSTSTQAPSSSPATSATPSSSAPRPASTATLSIISPKNGQVIHGTTVQLKVSLKDATIVEATTTNVVPDEGHLHVLLDDKLITMTGDTTQLISDVVPGQHLLKVEFVASDHFPFDPRVIAAVAFEVDA
jgi:cytoskeletal protein RodZ